MVAPSSATVALAVFCFSAAEFGSSAGQWYSQLAQLTASLRDVSTKWYATDIAEDVVCPTVACEVLAEWWQGRHVVVEFVLAEGFGFEVFAAFFALFLINTLPEPLIP